MTYFISLKVGINDIIPASAMASGLGGRSGLGQKSYSDYTIR